MFKILSIIISLLAFTAIFIYNKTDHLKMDEKELENKESIEIPATEPMQIQQDTIISDYIYPITGPGKIDGVIFYFAGIQKRMFEEEEVDHLIIDIDDFLYAKEGDEVQLAETLTIKIVKITNPVHPEIGKVYFDVIKKEE